MSKIENYIESIRITVIGKNYQQTYSDNSSDLSTIRTDILKTSDLLHILPRISWVAETMLSYLIGPNSQIIFSTAECSEVHAVVGAWINFLSVKLRALRG